MANKVLLLAGTKKGLFLFTSRDRKRWDVQGPFQKGKEINHAVRDAHSGRIYATANDPFFGSQLAWSDNGGKTWKSPKRSPAFSPKSKLTVDRYWNIACADSKQLYVGVAPAGLFHSDDAGKTWSEVLGITNHPTRKKWQPGAGGMCLHSIALDPSNPKRMFVGISAAGVFRTDDAGKTWAPMNRGTRADFMPVKYPELGQCVHKLRMATGNSSVLFQQNHCGMYRSDNAGASWTEITKGLPSDFGFPCAVHPRETMTAYFVPLNGAVGRCPPDNKLRVYRTRNGGKKWDSLTKGLPQSGAFFGVYREAMHTDTLDPAGIYFGTNTGKIFASRDDGDSWYALADNLPPVFSISVSEL